MSLEGGWPSQREDFDYAGKIVKAALERVSELRQKRGGGPTWILTSRLKTQQSIDDKIARKRRSKPEYQLSSITDVVGVRLIVESCAVVRQLAEHLRKDRVFSIRDADSEDFIDKARPDGYRGIHLIIDVPVKANEGRTVPVELQIRTVLQHQWAELSHAEFYKSVREIPALLLGSMRALGEILHGADYEFEQLRRTRLMDEWHAVLRDTLRGDVLEVLGGDPQACFEDRNRKGTVGNCLLELATQVRRTLSAENRDEQLRAKAAVLRLHEQLDALDGDVAKQCLELTRRTEAFVVCVTEESS